MISGWILGWENILFCYKKKDIVVSWKVIIKSCRLDNEIVLILS